MPMWTEKKCLTLQRKKKIGMDNLSLMIIALYHEGTRHRCVSASGIV